MGEEPPARPRSAGGRERRGEQRERNRREGRRRERRREGEGEVHFHPGPMLGPAALCPVHSALVPGGRGPRHRGI